MKKITSRTQTFIVCMLMLCGFIHAKDYHVSKKKLLNISNDLQTRTISEVIDRLKPGDNVIIHTGIYREFVNVNISGTKENPISFIAAEGEEVEISGANVLSDWSLHEVVNGENIYVSEWESLLKTDKRSYYPDNDYHKLIGKREQMWILGIPLHQVLEKDRLTRGTFFCDDINGKIYFQNASNESLIKAGKPTTEYQIEVSVRTHGMLVSGNYIHIKGISFTQAANHALKGALEINGDYLVVENCVFEKNNSIGADFRGKYATINKCVFKNNGQFGFTAFAAHHSLMTECLIENNGWKGYKLDWAAGGNKILFTRDFVIDKCIVKNNCGNGIWYDVGNEKGEVRNSFIIENQNAGVFYEISYELYAHDNVIVKNGLRSTFNAWGMAGGISLSSSPKCLIERNILVGNKEGFVLREQKRKTGLIEHYEAGYDVWKREHDVAVWNHDHIIRNNIIAHNRDAQVWAWFATKDKRHIPGEKQTITRDEDGQPVGLTLETLNLKFKDNVYSTSIGEFPFFKWGATWLSEKYNFKSIKEVNDVLSLEKGSIMESYLFKDISDLDFRIEYNQKVKEAYPKGQVPQVTLGIL
ncbi:right-handed parallel beta-helix repeat-containing protein [Joostella atrarenae]|uniref:Right-handed parallel beta-helix repeat-containing protein n=1 Tax=Joostella atrarenae TaxID=679257 RepID=A0ABS9J2P7_9FLAO|nr:right-handed parallel beta-helix repeat-containing protein [Joostella atrarenae]MCF8714717.1 right-handed parallel beta-helix repeat-containing protein [Joostella atrarenae]